MNEEPKYAATTRKTMALKATDKPKLIKPRSIEMIADKVIDALGSLVLEWQILWFWSALHSFIEA